MDYGGELHQRTVDFVREVANGDLGNNIPEPILRLIAWRIVKQLPKPARLSAPVAAEK